MGAELTVRQKILVAAVALSSDAESFSAEDLIVRAWELFPESFALRGFDGKYPDSNRVLAKLSGSDGLCGLGWLEHTDQRTYRATKKGRAVARQLAGVQSAVGAEPNVTDVIEPVAAKAPARPAPRAVKAAPVAEPKAAPVKARPASARVARVEPKAAPRVTEVLSSLTVHEVAAVQQIARAEALRKFLRGSPLNFQDACAFWGINSSMRPASVEQRLESTGALLTRAVESFGDDGVADPRLPSLSTCYGLFNLHRLMTDKFSRELNTLRLPLAAG